MRRSALRLERYETDKIESGYLEHYDRALGDLAENVVTVLELGIHKGGSLSLWSDYFPRGVIVGIDVTLPREFKPGERVRMFKGSQSDVKFLSQVANEVAPNGYDVIIDDASHIGELSKITFWHLFENHLRPGGTYVIEDWGTGYWPDWVDGKSIREEGSRKPSEPVLSRLLSEARRRLPKRLRRFSPLRRIEAGLRSKGPCAGHAYGMVGFIKELVDEQGAQDATRGSRDGGAGRRSKFQSMTIAPGIVFVRKNEDLRRPQFL